MKNKKLLFSIVGNVLLVICVVAMMYKYDVVGSVINKISNKTQITSSTKNNYYYGKKGMFEVLPNTSDEIIFLGDSITEMCEWSEMFQNDNIKNRGISGDTTEGVLNRLSEVVESKPEKIFLMIGINDIGDGVSSNVIIKNYNTIIESINKQTPDTQICLQSVLPCNSDLLDKNDRNKRRTYEAINELNTKIQAIAQSNNLTYIDLSSKFLLNNKLDTKYTYDGIHLSKEGYLLWKNIVEKYVID